MTAESISSDPRGTRSAVGYVLRLLTGASIPSRVLRAKVAKLLRHLDEQSRAEIFQKLTARSFSREALLHLGASERELVLAGVDAERCCLCKHFSSGVQFDYEFSKVAEHLSPDEIAAAESEDVVVEHDKDGVPRGRLNNIPSGEVRKRLKGKPNRWEDYGVCGLEPGVGVHGESPCMAFGQGGKWE